jgi:hypothetical protein
MIGEKEKDDADALKKRWILKGLRGHCQQRANFYLNVGIILTPCAL